MFTVNEMELHEVIWKKWGTVAYNVTRIIKYTTISFSHLYDSYYTVKCYQETSPRWQVHNTCGIPHEKQHIGTGESSRHVVTAEVQGTGKTAGSQTGAVPAWHTTQSWHVRNTSLRYELRRRELKWWMGSRKGIAKFYTFSLTC